MKYTNKDTIFVQIPSYRDAELQHTLQDLFKKAKKPENIFVGICHQYDMKGDEDKHLFEVEFPRKDQLRIDEVDYRESKGMCWARNRSQKLCKDEKWSLRLDAHHRFKENWDEELVLAIYKLKKDAKVIISQCLPGYNIKTGEKEKESSNRICCKKFIGTYGYFKTLEYAKSPNLTLFSYGGFVFGLSKYVSDSLINPVLDNLDEIPFSVTKWTKGIDIYTYHQPVIWHYWTQQEKDEAEHKKRKKYKVAGKKAKEVQEDLLGIKKTKDEEVIKLNKEFPLGTKRSIRDYERFSGINLRKRAVREHSSQGCFEDYKIGANIKQVKDIFG